MSQVSPKDPPAPGGRYVEALTGLRGIAALFVFLFHYLYFNPDVQLGESVPIVGLLLQFPFDFGFMGVDLFFVLSGFLLSLPFARWALGAAGRVDLKRYFARRLLRVFPAYYFQFAVIFVVGAWFLTYQPMSGKDVLAHFIMYFNVGSEPVRPMVGVWWTLPVEFSFYLVLPLLAVFMRPRWLWAFLPLLVASVAYRWWASQHFEAGNVLMLAANHLPGSLPEFLLGMVAGLVTQGFKDRPIPPWVLDVALLVCMLAVGAWFRLIVGPNGEVYWQGHWSMIIAPTVLGILLATLVWAVYNGSRLGRLLFSNRVVHFLGSVSYSLYLWHFVVMQQLTDRWGAGYVDMAGIPKFLLTLVIVLAVSWLSYWFIERPFFRQRAFKKEGSVPRPN